MRGAPILYLSATDVRAAMPSVEQRIELARRTMLALAADAEVPPKLGVHPRETASLAHAMPALLRGSAANGDDDLLGIKWVTAFNGNRDRGVDAIHATVVLNSATTGEPLAILDGGPITAQRTAAVSAVALREWWPEGNGTCVAIIGAGIQGEAHLDVVAHVARGDTRLAIADRNADRAEQLAACAREMGRFQDVAAMTDINRAVETADVVLTMVSFGPDRQAVPATAFARSKLVVAVDYDMCVPADVARASRLFVTDDIQQFEATRTATVFAGYPTPDASIGEALAESRPAPRDSGPTVVTHLGVGLADVVFADAIYRRALEMQLGTALPR
jgi:ornithine cyclodeaminase/alanine dehydrogenase-like protein (mu-crystallin family)